MTAQELRRRLEGRVPGLMDATGRYAVLVPLVEGEDGWRLLYEVRAAGMRRQPGEVCFPGGRIEGEETPEACALRETWEELGIPAQDVQILGRLDFLVHRANFLTYPILARIGRAAAGRLTLNPAEVGETFQVPVDYLLSHPAREYRYTLVPQPPEDFPYDLIGIPRDYRWQRGGETVSVYSWQGHAIWGMTGRITRCLLDLWGKAP
ncbi:MAG: CoA pyrophosphatase [Lawsonibacter sp.]|nr:CoA pyrophosphatase [Lawsonibacter sp.]